MEKLYEVWQSHDPQGYGWCQLWQDLEPVRLPLPWAREYARELFERQGLPVQLRSFGPRAKGKVYAGFGADWWSWAMVDR